MSSAHDDGRSRGAARLVLEAAVVFVLTLAYLWLFRTYGFDVVDEGTQLAQIDLVVRGARPYLDFETGYTPLYFQLYAALWRLAGGGELLATRTFGVLLHATTIALLFAAARRWFGLRTAIALAAFELAFLLPVSPRVGAPFNTPYPGWLAALLALVAQVAVATIAQRRLERDARATPTRVDAAITPLLLAAGVASGLAFSVKPNAGLLALGGALLALLPAWPARDRAAVVLAALVRVAAIAGTLLLLGGAALQPGYFLALVVPVALVVARAAPAGAHDDVRPWRDVAALAVGFVVPTAAWVLPLVAELGVGRFAREVLLLDGGGVIDAYLLPYVPPGPAAAVVCLALVGGALAAVASGRSGATMVLSRAAKWTISALLLAGVALAGVAPGATSVRVVAEEACLWLGPIVVLLGATLLPRAPDAPRAHALLAFAAVYALQVFPRPDLIHVAMGGPPLLLAAGATWSFLAAPLVRPDRTWSRIASGVFAVVLVLCAVRAYPALAARVARPQAPLDAGPRASLTIAADHAAEHAWLGETVRAIAARSADGERVFYFPDLAGLGFLAGRPPATFYLYFVPGRPDARGEQRTIAELERTTPRLAVTGAPRVAAFAGADAYFARLRAFLDESYPPVETLPGAVLRARRDEPRACGGDCTRQNAG